MTQCLSRPRSHLPRPGGVFCTLAALSLLACSCSRQSIEGSVQVDGRPLEQGYINFRPLKDAKGTPLGAPIQNGKYTVAAWRQTPQGPFRVEITALGKTGKQVTAEGGRVVDVEGQVLPARYNTRSTLQVDIRPNQANTFPFSIESK